MRTYLSLIALAIGLLAGSALGQNAITVKPTRISGTLVTLSAQTLVIKPQTGDPVSIILPAGLKILASAKKSVADIKAGDFVAATSAKGADGKLSAKDIHILPESMRGVAEGHRDMDANTTMTNATVSGIAGAQQGGNLTLKYKDGTTEIAVSPDTPVSTLVPASDAQLKPGAAISAIASQQAGGLVASFVSVQ
jgi:hypothetical protein